MIKYRGPFVLGHPDEAWFDCNMMQKDMQLALELGPRARRAAADDGGLERAADGRARAWASTTTTSRSCTTCSRDGGRAEGGRRDGDRGAAEAADRARARTGDDRQMLRIRAFEEQANQLYRSAKMPGLTHLYIGEEAVAVGVCSALRRDDTITSTHRGHGHCIAKGATTRLMFCELLGKEEGYCRGKGGSMHIADHAERQPRRERDRRRLGRDRDGRGVLGEAARHRPRLGLLLRRGRARPGPALRGDEHGVALEAAGRLRLREQPLQRVHELRRGDRGHDPGARRGVRHPGRGGRRAGRRAVYEATARAVERARRGDGPSFLLCATYRYHGHHVGDVDRAYYR